MATVATAKTEFEVADNTPTDSSTTIKLLQLHQDGTPFVLPSKRGMDPRAPGFDTQGFMDLLTEDMMYIQHAKLREILEVQGEVEYLQNHGLGGRTDVESFRKCVPIVNYSDLEGDIMRLVNGEKSCIFTVDPISNFSFSSGTTAGKPKFLPDTARSVEDFPFIKAYEVALIRKDFPNLKRGKGFGLGFVGEQIVTPSGIKAGAWSTNFFKSPFFRNRVRTPHDSYCVPDEVILCNDSSQGMYCHLLCALAQASEIVQVTNFYAASIVAAIRFLQKQWPVLVEDIKTGMLSKKITEVELRAAVEKTLQPNPDLASTIKRECSKEDWEGIIPRLFPNAQLIICILSGGMLQYAPALQHFAGHLSLVSPCYSASECLYIGINANMKCAPEDITYMLWPDSAYYEFIPLDDDGAEVLDGENLKVLEACELEIGKDYELVVTSVVGFYRYRLNDVIRLKSFRKTVPVFEFVRRKNVLLSVYGDKTDEEELQAVMNKSTELLKGTAMELSDYTSTADFTSLPGGYRIFWEMTDSSYGSNLNHNILQECANMLDQSFNDEYRRWRKGSTIAPLKLDIVREGTFDRVMNSAVSRGATPTQYKTPRCVNHSHALEILNDGVTASFVSSITPDTALAASFLVR